MEQRVFNVKCYAENCPYKGTVLLPEDRGMVSINCPICGTKSVRIVYEEPIDMTNRCIDCHKDLTNEFSEEREDEDSPWDDDTFKICHDCALDREFLEGLKQHDKNETARKELENDRELYGFKFSFKDVVIQDLRATVKYLKDNFKKS